MISAESLGYAYQGQPPALREVSFHLPAGQTLGLVGANGGGKSTLLSILAGLYTPSEGKLTLAGQASPGGERGVRAASALVMQEADLQIIGSTVEEDLSLGAEGQGPGLSEAALAAATAFGLEDILSRAVHELSWGQKKRLCLAAAQLKKPQVLLLDEPFAGLDYPGILRMRAILAANKKAGLTQVVAAHDLEPLADLADAWLVLEAGRAVARGSAREVFPLLKAHQVRPPCSWQAGLGVTVWE